MATTASVSPSAPPPSTPTSWRLAVGAGVALLAAMAWLLQDLIGVRGQAALGAVCLVGVVAAFSANLRAVSWRAVGWGLVLQLLLALFVLKFEVAGLEWLGVPDGTAPGRELFQALGGAIGQFVTFTDAGSRFLFGPLVDPAKVEEAFNVQGGFLFGLAGLPVIVFVSSFFSLLYYFGILQAVVRLMARVMVYLMGTSGAETLSAAANVFMGQTEAPLIIKPYVPRMTQSELLAVMVGGMATISGALMAVYMRLGADEVAILATSVMAAPCGLYLSKIMLPEQELSETRGEVRVSDESPHANAIDALASGASDGMMLALNVAAMLIAFLALLALIDYLLSDVRSGQSLWLTLAEAEGWVMVRSVLALLSAFWLLVLLANAVLRRAGAPRPLHRVLGESPERRAGSLLVLAGLFPAMLPAVDLLLLVLPERLSLGMLFGKLFAPVAFLLGVEGGDVEKLAELLGIKLAGNEFLAYARMRDLGLTERGRMIATFALTGFANFGSVGILIGGIGAMAPGRRPDLARLGARALLVGFVATLVNAAIAAVLL